MSSRNFPYAITKRELDPKFVKDFPLAKDGLVQIGPEKWTMPAVWEPFFDQIYNFEARPDDVWLCGHPRSGTTWTQEMIWLICNNLDYKTALNTPIDTRFPYLEHNITMPKEYLADVASYENLFSTSSRRFIKTHSAMKIMTQSHNEVGAKIVYIARNPKDVCVSSYHFLNSTLEQAFTGSFESFAEYFMDDLAAFTPYWKHVLDGWENRHLDNVHFMFYEDCKADLATSLRKLAEFLGHPLKEEDLPKLMDHLSFDSCRKNLSINHLPNPKIREPNFVRRGLVGGNPEMTLELSEKFDKWTEKNLAGTNFEFPVKV